MRLRERRRIEKRARALALQGPFFERSLAALNPEQLLAVALDTTASWQRRAVATHILSRKSTPGELVTLFFQQEDRIELWETALTMEYGAKPDVVPALARALYDENPNRRHAAARALGWIWNAGVPAAKALVTALNDRTQPQPVREEACESLAYLRWRQSIPALVAASKEADVCIRFWAAFGLGGIRHPSSGALRSEAADRLKEMLTDTEVAPGWYAVRQEALSMLASSLPEYRTLEKQEKTNILANPNASASDLKWAAF